MWRILSKYYGSETMNDSGGEVDNNKMERMKKTT